MIIGDRLRALREEKNLSQGDINQASILSHRRSAGQKSFTVDLKTAWLENQARLSFFQHIRAMRSNIAETLERSPLPDLHGTNNRIALRRGLLA